MANYTANFLYLGNYAPIDTLEGPGNIIDEDAAALLGTYDGHNSPLQVVSVTADDANDDGTIQPDDPQQTPETFSYVLGPVSTTSGLDSEVLYDAEVLYGDGTVNTVQVWVIQLQNGDTFITLAQGALSNASVQSVTLTSVASADYMGIAAPVNEITNLQFVCFARGTMIATPEGQTPVEALRPGMAVVTHDKGAQPVIWVSRRKVSAPSGGNAPVRFPANALAWGLPCKPLIVTGQHRMLMPDGKSLGPAKGFLGLPGVRHSNLDREFEFFTFLLPEHGLVLANGLWAESFWPGALGLAALPAEDRGRLYQKMPMLRIFGACAYGAPARPFLTRAKTARVLAAAFIPTLRP